MRVRMRRPASPVLARGRLTTGARVRLALGALLLAAAMLKCATMARAQPRPTSDDVVPRAGAGLPVPPPACIVYVRRPAPPECRVAERSPAGPRTIPRAHARAEHGLRLARFGRWEVRVAPAVALCGARSRPCDAIVR